MNILLRKAERSLNKFLQMESKGGIMLGVAALLAIVVANSHFADTYDYVLNQVKFHVGFYDLDHSFDVQIKKSILHLINDGFMAIFFFLVGLEIKREVVSGELSTRSRALLPLLAAIGGMVVPALLFWMINYDSPETINGWAIPAATDIAFALGVLAILGSRVPVQLKILLTAIAVIDDLLAIIIIALFYAEGLNIVPLMIALPVILLLAAINLRGIKSKIPYVVLGIILWMAVLESGVHATLAGVITALFVPIYGRDPENEKYGPCETMEHALHPWVAYLILPVFAFANAGLPLAGITMDALQQPLTLGIIVGLVVGKPVGIFSMMFLAIALKISPKPKGTSWIQLFALSMLCGIGFTMSLFVGSLAFDHNNEMQNAVRTGVLFASIFAALVGSSILYGSSKSKTRKAVPKR